MSIRTRFAPSPTGYLHVGGARTALYNWLFARHCQGQFILRIEDTDIERSTPEAVQAILDGMAWLGLDADEGPFYQTQHLARYQEQIEVLLAKGEAYRCTCSKARLDQIRADQIANKQTPRYDGHCRDRALSSQESAYVVRFKQPQSGEVVIDDLILGPVVIANQELDDFIIARADGIPTYNFTVVVDDADMAITHVIRGNDHLNNTPKQINLFKALGLTPPRYGHLPMILGDDGQKLSKRHGAVSVMAYRDEGYLPEALLNYLVRLGWSHGDQEIFTLEEMIQYFDLSTLSKSAAAFNTEKLRWLNHHYIKHLPVATLLPHLEWQLVQAGYDLSQGPDLEKIILAFRERSHTLKEMAEKVAYCYQVPSEYDIEACKKHLTPHSTDILTAFAEALATLKAWTVESLHLCLQDFIQVQGIKLPHLAQPLRIALTGHTQSPSIDVTLALLEQAEAVRRIKDLVNFVVK